MKGADKPHVLMMGQTPPPWHGQAVATQILFEHDWPGFQVHRLRMEFSQEIGQVGRFSWHKIFHLLSLVTKGVMVLTKHPGCILFYPPASAKWIPFLRDVCILLCLRKLAGKTVFIYHASNLPKFCHAVTLRSFLSNLTYGNADVSLEVAQERYPPHHAFEAKSWKWCPCAIEVPQGKRKKPTKRNHLEVLFVGSLQEGKGVLEILRTAKILRDRGRECDFLFRIVGKWFSEDFKQEALGLQQDFELEKMVVFEGQLTGQDKWDAYASSDLFFFPTHYSSEASPIVLMEALGMGLGVITTEWAGIPALLRGCPTAELLPPRSPSSYAEALERSFRSMGRISAVKSQSKQFYAERFLPEQFISRVEAAFRAAAGCDEPGLQVSKEPAAINVIAYLADQNPKLGRSFGISRMTNTLLSEFAQDERIQLGAVVSKSSVQPPSGSSPIVKIPWSTRRPVARAITDNLHPVLSLFRNEEPLWYFPKGFIPQFPFRMHTLVATVHDTIIQYYQDHYPDWRTNVEYSYWRKMLCNTLTHASAVITVSAHARSQIERFILQQKLRPREILVTFEPCVYESIPQPEASEKSDYVLHLGSREPHKKTEWLIHLWDQWATEQSSRSLPILHVVGRLPDNAKPIVDRHPRIKHLSFLEDRILREQFLQAKALIFPSEIEGFGLPAIEAYYLGTPVCFVRDTAVEEILHPATQMGGFDLDDPESLWNAMSDVLAMQSGEIYEIGLTLRKHYNSKKVIAKMKNVFDQVTKDRPHTEA